MKKFKIKRDIFLKKSTWLVLGAFAVALINIPRFNTQAGKSLDSANFSPDTIKVLEIGPGNQFKLTNTGNNPNEIEELTDQTTNKKVQVTHMSMTKFISSVDDISGKYDVVALTNQTNGLPDKFNVGNVYRQYTSAFSQDMGYAHYLSDASTSGQTLNSKKLVEYYPENDITQKRAKEIVKMINKGQLVYVDSSITSNQKLASTNLSTIFNGQGIGKGITTKENFKSVTSNDITLEKIVDYYNKMTTSSKRVKVSEASGPSDEVRQADGTVTNERAMQFSVKANAEANETLTLNLYLDYDGDGVFREDELSKTQEVTGSNDYQTYTLNYQLYKGFIGYLDWKVEVVRPSGVKTNVQSGVIMKCQANNGTGKKEIKVLQIYPNTDTADYFDNIYGANGQKSRTRLDQNEKFMALLKTPALDDYDIKIDAIKLDDFSAQYGTAEGKKHIEDQYNMVIVGFSDGFNAENYQSLDFTNDDALKDLQNFIADGNSAMFTHDTISLNPTKDGGMSKFTRTFKDYVGQSRYLDPFRNGETSNLYTTVDKNGNKVTTNIPHDNVSVSGAVSLGQTVLSTNGDGNKQNSQTGSRLWEQTQTKQVKSVNDAQITTYPYDLRNVNASNPGIVNVSLTHTQWYQLNLEDEDVVPYYNLVSNNKYNVIDSGDSRNFEYTYAKKNITYSGTGHSGVGDVDQELKLFVNTIIKCERGGNTKPEIENLTSSKVKIENGSTVDGKIDSLSDYKFISVPTDADDDNLTVKITADGQEVYSGTNLQAGSSIDVTIPKAIYEKKEKGYTFEVATTVTDIMGATETKTFKLVCDGNRVPTITNKANAESKETIGNGSQIESSKFVDFNFVTTPSDPDEEDQKNLKVAVLVDNQDVTTMMVDDKKVDANTDVSSDEPISVTVPKSAFQGKKPGDKINVQTTVTDTKGKTDTKNFQIVIAAITPEVSHGVFDKELSDKTAKFTANNEFANLSTIDFAGNINAIFNQSGSVTLKVNKTLRVQGDVKIYRVKDGEKSEEWTMMLSGKASDGDSLYTLKLDPNEVAKLGAVEEEGMTFVVRYQAKLNEALNKEEGVYTNTLTFDDKSAAVTVKLKVDPPVDPPVKPTIEPVDLF